MKKLFNKKVRISLYIIVFLCIAVCLLYGFLSQFGKRPLFYLSSKTVERIDAIDLLSSYEYELINSDEEKLIGILSSMQMKKKKESYQELNYPILDGGIPSRFKIKLKWNKSVYISVKRVELPFCIVIDDEKVFECDKEHYEDYKEIDNLFNRICRENRKWPEPPKSPDLTEWPEYPAGGIE